MKKKISNKTKINNNNNNKIKKINFLYYLVNKIFILLNI